MDCGARCGNGIVAGAEQCDPPGSCPTACPNRACTTFTLEGSAAACTAICVESGKQSACAPDDGCCPAGCNGNNDNDCLITCDNGAREANETCDPLASCPSSCPAMGCQLRALVNPGTCRAACQNTRMQTMCASGDGCCPPGCNSTNDAECPVACGNGVVERGETCEPVAQCTGLQAACRSDQNTIRTGAGNPAACTFRCTSAARPCGPSDGFCPAGCGADADCLPRPASCTRIEWCVKPFAPDQGKVICITNVDARCTNAERVAECATESRTVCGAGHARPIIYSPPIGGMPSG